MSDVEPVPPVVLERLRRELTQELLGRVAGYACRRVGVLRKSGLPCLKDPRLQAEELAQDAAVQTVLGHRTWNPEVPLFQHLCGVVRSETTAASRQRARQRNAPIEEMRWDDSHDGDIKVAAELARRGSARSARPRHDVSLTDANHRLTAALRIAARGDQDVLHLLDAYQAGAHAPTDVQSATGLNRKRYINARRRLDRMIDALPDALIEGTHDALEVSYVG